MAPNKAFPFQQTTALRGTSYNLSTGYFTLQKNGTYVFHLSIATYAITGIKVSMHGSTLDVDIKSINRTAASQTGWYTFSRDFIYTLFQGDQVYLDLNQGFAVSDSLRQTSWSAFLLDDLMYPLIVFSASRTSGLPAKGKIDYTATLTNLGNAWNSTVDMFTAQRDGVYVFSLSCDIPGGLTYITCLYINGSPSYSLAVEYTTPNGNYISSRTFAVSLVANDTVYVYLNSYNEHNNINISSNAAFETSFAGFLFEPLSGPKVIWSVHQTKFLYSQLRPFPFDNISVNVGNGWNTTTNKFVATHAGVYQLHLTASSFYSGQIDYQLIWNDIAYANIYSNAGIEVVTRSRAIMIELSVGDTLYIATNKADALISDPTNKFISFTGFLISP